MTELEARGDYDGVQAPLSAGTPLHFHEADPIEAARRALELDQVLALIAGHARGPLGVERVRRRRPLPDAGAVARELAPVGELLALWRRNETVDVPPVPELAGVLARLRVEGSVLDGSELIAIRQTLTAARIAVAELSRIAPDAPNAARLIVSLPDRAIDRRLGESLADDGELLDTASPKLLEARREIHAARERLIRKLEAILRGTDEKALPAGAQVTVRGDRYVIPVRRDSRSRPEGIVHDESASHGTLFVEPTAAIEFGNALRSAIAEAEREALRVLRELTERCRPALDTIAAAHEMCVQGDDLVARARYAHSVDAVAPKTGTNSLVLRAARHPLLLGRGIAVVPFDLELEPGERSLLISGPNTGGKTVLLKTVGLAALLTQSGIIPPVGAGTELPHFDLVFADIGDHQSIAADLSTFSGHVTALRRILESAGPGTMVLMDEIGSGTDPAEGGALAGAALRALTRRGALTIATTHLGALKTLAGEVPGIVNGSLEFDADALRPTFAFRKGVPGRSYGLAIARRLGVDSAVLAEAEATIPTAERALDELLAQVEARSRELETRERDVAARAEWVGVREANAEAIATNQAAREKELKRQEREAEQAGRREARRHLLDARATVEEALRKAQSATDAEQAREARRVLEDAAKSETEALEAAARSDAESEALGGRLIVSQRVRVGAGGTGTIREIRSDGKAVVALGAVKVVVAMTELTPVAGPAPKETLASAPSADRAEPVAATEIDLRGLRGDEAEAVTLAAIDQAVVAENPSLRIIHGMGTGVVRDRVRRILRSDRRVSRFEFAPRNQGGTGVTIVELGRGG